MILNKLSVVSFKNIRAASLEFSPKINCFIGRNGMGKTNLLDAIYYLSFCKSAVNQSDSLVISHGDQYCVLEGSYADEDGSEEKIYCGFKLGQKKHFKRNGKEYRRLSQHIGLIPLILVSPQDISLIAGSGEERRRFMDIAIAQYDNEYMTALSGYNKALVQRNSLLRQEDEPDPELLSILEEQMAETGTLVFEKRCLFTQKLKPLANEVYGHITGGTEKVDLNYVSHCQRGPLLDVIRRDRAKDRIIGYSLHGIHRDDIEMTLNGYPIRREGSQGQAKTLALALRLAQFQLLESLKHRTTPLLLLDDIFDKLDSDRVEQIIDLVGGDSFGQIFITDTNRDHLDRILERVNQPHSLFYVDKGTFTRQE